MTEENVLAPEAGPEVVTEAQENQAADVKPELEEGATEDAEAAEAAKSPAKERRERDKQIKQRLWDERVKAEERAQEAESRAARLEQVLKGKEPPKEADFPDPIEYAAVRAAFLSRQDQQSERAQEARDEATAAQEEIDKLAKAERQLLEQSWAAQADEAKGRYADFEKVAFTAPITDDVCEIIVRSDIGADIAYHLGKNHYLARQISAMPPIEAARAIGRLEASLAARPAQPQTNAPPPITPVRGSRPGQKSPESMSMSEYIAARRTGAIE